MTRLPFLLPLCLGRFCGKQLAGFFVLMQVPVLFGKVRMLLLSAVLCHAALLSGCGGVSGEKTDAGDRSSVTVPTGEMTVYAQRFRLCHRGEYSTLEVIPGQSSLSDTLRYLLLPSGKAVPSGFGGYSVIRTPVTRIALFSTTAIGFIDQLDEIGGVVGLSRPEFVNNPLLKQRIKEGKVTEIGMPFSPDLESIVALQPELVLAPALPPSRKAGYQTLEQSGIPVLVVAEWLESTPLGRAEWVKLFGALFGKGELARQRFAETEAAYLRISSISAKASERPRVLTGLPYKDSWFVPAGGSYVAALLHDAGADYPWRTLKGAGSAQLDIEAVYPVALEAEFWLNPGSVSSRAELLALDARFRDVRAVKEGRVYNNDRQINAAGGNAYWEIGVVRPDLILKDLVMLLHPGLLRANGLQEGAFTFYREVK